MGTIDSVVAALQTAVSDANAVVPVPAAVVADLQRALADAQAMLPAPVTGSFPQYYLDDMGLGPSSTSWSNDLYTRWPAYHADHTWHLGNWLDANDVSQGATPYATVTVGPKTTLNAYLDIDITPLAQKWMASQQNRGAYLGNCKPHYSMTVGGRLSANPPQLVVQTDVGSYTLSGIAAGWYTSSALPIATTQSCAITNGAVTLLHFPTLLQDVKGNVEKATMRLYVAALACPAPMTFTVMQTDGPYCPVGADGEAPVYGLSAEVGEDNLNGNADVFCASDFRQSQLFSKTDGNNEQYANKLYPAPLPTFNSTASPTLVPGFAVEFADDPDHPGRQYVRANMVHGNGDIVATSSMSFLGQYATLPSMTPDNPMRGVLASDALEEIYVRSYIMLENDFWTAVDGVKGGVGIDARMGVWDDDQKGYWQVTTGNSGTPGTGLKVNSKRTPGRYEYQGHAMRQHWDHCRPSGTPYQNFRPIIMMVSHLGPFDWQPYGTEEERRCGTVVVPKGKKFCIEWHVKMNSIDLSAPDALGNGVANHDGIMELWVDGVHRWAKTDFAWRRHPEMGITGHFITWMHGGLVPAAPGENMHYRHYDFCAAKRYIGPRND